MSEEKSMLKQMSVEELQDAASAIRQELDAAVQEFVRLHDQGIEAFDPIARELAVRGITKVRPAIAKYWSRAAKYARHPERYPKR